MSRYIKKRLAIGFVYLLILAIIAGVVYLIITRPSVTTCSDNIKNQGEDGVDCGGPCSPCEWQLQEDIEVVWVKAIKTQKDYVDLAAKIRNPNNDFGAKVINYEFDLYNDKEELITSVKGNSYIFPKDSRYVIEQKIPVFEKIDKTEFKINSVDWQELVSYEEPDLLIRNPQFEQSPSKVEAIGTLENKSNYDFNIINILAVLFDKDDEALAAGEMELKTILSQESRYFKINWAFPVGGEVKKADITAETNIFLDENFMKRYGGDQEKFQEY